MWCVGCSTGEEAYELAARLPRADVLATDVCPSAIALARAATYPALAPPPGLRDLGLSLGARADRRWTVVPEVRARVRFEALNLVDPWPLELARFDLIVCRNVLIYFSRPAHARALTRLGEALAPGGWLALGPCEPHARSAGLRSVPLDEGFFAYQREEAGAAASGHLAGIAGLVEPLADAAPAPATSTTFVSTVAPRTTDATAEPTAAEATPAEDAAAAASCGAPGEVALDEFTLLLSAASEAQANGDRAAASEALTRAADLADLSAERHWCLGRAHRDLGDPEPAIAALRRALALDPDLLPAALQLAGVLRDGGERAAAARVYERCLRMCARPRPDWSPWAHDARALCRRRLAELTA